MHVLYIIGQSTGGLPHYTAELANGVAEHAEVTVMKPTETSADELFAEEVTVIEAFDSIGVSMPKLHSLNVNPLELLRGILSYNNLKRIREIDADVVHDTTDLFPQVKLFAGLHGIDDHRPFVVTRHEVSVKRFSFSRPPVLAEEIVNYLLPNVHPVRIIAHTENQKRALIERGSAPDRIEVIPHGAYSAFGNHEEVDVAVEDNSLLFFGNIVPPKGLDTLVAAIPLVKRELPDVTLLIAGEGRIPEAARATIEAHSENFEVHNYFVPNDEVGDLFGRAEVVTIPYRRQGGTKGHSGALSTAYSFGKPVVASTASEFPALVKATGCGLVVPPEDPAALAEAIVEILTDENAKTEMSANSLRMAAELSWENIAERHLTVYEDVIRERATVAK
jgi:glycosyltransferase involved in cell wall biosynthesis